MEMGRRRVQLASDKGVRRVYTRNGDDISKAFPIFWKPPTLMQRSTANSHPLTRGGVASFNELQQRMNRKTVSPKQMADRPAMLRAYDILNENGEDLRPLPFRDRRKRLERFVVSLHNARIDLSPLVPSTTPSSWRTSAAIRPRAKSKA